MAKCHDVSASPADKLYAMLLKLYEGDACDKHTSLTQNACAFITNQEPTRKLRESDMTCSDGCACWVSGRLLRTEPKCLRRRGRRSQPQQHQHMNTQGTQAGPCMRERSHHKTIGLRRRKFISVAHTVRDDKNISNTSHVFYKNETHHNTHLSSHTDTHSHNSQTCVATRKHIISHCITHKRTETHVTNHYPIFNTTPTHTSPQLTHKPNHHLPS